jgi:putative tryptophan/tyrosine transport system substrate-binding protein
LVRTNPKVIVVRNAGVAEIVLRGVPFPEAGFVSYRKATDAAAATLGIRTRYVQFERPDDLDRLFWEMATEREQALLIWGNPHVYAHRKRIYDLTIRYRLPAIYDVGVYKEEGLMVYTAKMEAVLREAATYVDRILRGAGPGDLPIGQPKTFELIVNLKTAKALGLPMPPALLRRADELIQ